jgi:hypothetical protein
MGLDMYLTRQKTRIDYPDRDCLKSLTGVMCEQDDVMYWRKANAIHGWFVENVQDGVDDCSPFEVTKEHFEELYSLTQAVMNDNSKANELLPACSGFFFGGNEYDEYYFDMIKETNASIKEILENWQGDYEYFYQSSW